ncbi:MAG: hypothetical protein WAV18_31675, partial [Roseiarcus sp.]
AHSASPILRTGIMNSENVDAHVARPLPTAEVAPIDIETDLALGGGEFQKLLQENERRILAESPLRFYLIQSLLACSAGLSRMALALRV